MFGARAKTSKRRQRLAQLAHGKKPTGAKTSKRRQRLVKLADTLKKKPTVPRVAKGPGRVSRAPTTATVSRVASKKKRSKRSLLQRETDGANKDMVWQTKGKDSRIYYYSRLHNRCTVRISKATYKSLRKDKSIMKRIKKPGYRCLYSTRSKDPSRNRSLRFTEHDF